MTLSVIRIFLLWFLIVYIEPFQSYANKKSWKTRLEWRGEMQFLDFSRHWAFSIFIHIFAFSDTWHPITSFLSQENTELIGVGEVQFVTCLISSCEGERLSAPFIFSHHSQTCLTRSSSSSWSSLMANGRKVKYLTLRMLTLMFGSLKRFRNTDAIPPVISKPLFPPISAFNREEQRNDSVSFLLLCLDFADFPGVILLFLKTIQSVRFYRIVLKMECCSGIQWNANFKHRYCYWNADLYVGIWDWISNL